MVTIKRRFLAVAIVSILSILTLVSFTYRPAPPTQTPVTPSHGVALILGSAYAAVPSHLDQIIEAAKKEGEVVVRWPRHLSGREGLKRVLAEGFNKKWGLNLNVRILLNTGMDRDVATVISELNAGRQPSWDTLVGSGPTIQRLQQRGFIEAVDWPRIFSHITPKMLDKNLSGSVILHVNWYVPYYNTNAISRDDLANLPKKWEDFLEPRWRKKLIHPLSTRQEVLLARAWGEKKATEFTRQLVKQDLLLARFPEAKSRLFAGERPLAYFGDYPTWLSDAKKKGAPVKAILGMNPQPTVYFIQAIPKNSAHPNAVKLFVAYLLTPEAQQILWQAAYGSPFVPGSPIRKLHNDMAEKGAQFVTFGDLKEDERRNRKYNKILGF